jgi:tetratricopeptide (TPR) repeat protein
LAKGGRPLPGARTIRDKGFDTATLSGRGDLQQMLPHELDRQPDWWRARLQAGEVDAAAADNGIGRALFKLHRLEEAIPYLRRAVEGRPKPQTWGRLAACLDRHGSQADQLWAWSALLQLSPRDETARARLADLLEGAGRLAEAAQHARALAEADPPSAVRWTRLARLLTDLGDDEAAIEAWRKVTGLTIHTLEADDRLAQLGRRRAHGPRPAGPRIAVVGNCQAYGIGICIRAIVPDAEVKSVHWADVAGPGAAERLAAELDRYDLVVSHPSKAPGPLQTAALRARLARLAPVPSIHFTGLHPDIVWLPHEAWRSHRTRMGSYHSGLVMAGFSMGLDQTRVLELFNAYVFAQLGYFDEYAKAAQYHVRAGEAVGLDLAGLFAPEGLARPFMHAPNHPSLAFLEAIARGICLNAGLPVGDAALPPDPFATHLVWPVYPEIARRLDCRGSLTFLPGAGEDESPMGLEGFVAESYRVYEAMPLDALDLPRATAARAVLKGLGI